MNTDTRPGNIPVLFVEGQGLAEAWEKSLLAVFENGCRIQTEYDQTGDPPSRDCSLTLVIHEPLSEPMIHRDMPGGLEDLQEYVLEVLDGIKDHWVRDPDDPEDTRWEYTYHQRLCRYSLPGSDQVYDQIDLLVEKLSQVPYSRRAQAVTWKVWEDNTCYDPACLQSIWCRLLPAGKADNWRLNMNVRFRSNDAYKAAFMNMFALIMLQQRISERITARTGWTVQPGRYVHQADSYHIYGSYLEEFRQRFLTAYRDKTLDQRTLKYGDVKVIMEMAVPEIKAKVARLDRAKGD